MKLPTTMVLVPLLVAAVLALPAALAACQDRCGDVHISYPFGIGPGCYLEAWPGDRSFELTCFPNGTAFTAVDQFEVLNIDVVSAELRVKNLVSSWCYNASSQAMEDAQWMVTYNSTAFRVSSTKNVLTVVGCNALAYLGSKEGDVENRHLVGCHAACPKDVESPRSSSSSLVNGSCNGTAGGCCQMVMPPGIRFFNLSFLEGYDITSDIAEYNPCSHAMVVEKEAFQFRASYVTTRELLSAGERGQVPTVLDWVVGNQTCKDFNKMGSKNRTAYACVSDHSECIDSKNGPGYLCNCTKGYTGNPYSPDGCKDIDECMEKPCSDDAICRDIPGGHECLCSVFGSSPLFRYKTKPGGDCAMKSYILAGTGTSIGVVLVAVMLSWTYAFQEKKRLAAIKKRYFKQHGGLLLFEELKSRQGRQGRLSFTIFSKQELEEATNNFDERHVLGKGGNGTVYRGDLRDGRTVAIKRCRVAADERQRREFGKEVLILSQVNHRNIVKLYGCCLEVEVPMLVYQFIPDGTLYQLLHGSGSGDAPPPPPLSLAVRLKIAHEAAEALAYLHSTAAPPIIHGDVKSANILLDAGYAARVSDFGAAALAPAGEAHIVTLVQGTCGYLDPEYMQTCRLTDRSDVYSFGVVLLELLTRRKALALAPPTKEEERSLAALFLARARDGRRLDELVDPQIRGEVVGGEVLDMVAALARQCLEISGDKRPSMIEVAEELGSIRRMCSSHACRWQSR